MLPMGMAHQLPGEVEPPLPATPLSPRPRPGSSRGGSSTNLSAAAMAKKQSSSASLFAGTRRHDRNASNDPTNDDSDETSTALAHAASHSTMPTTAHTSESSSTTLSSDSGTAPHTPSRADIKTPSLKGRRSESLVDDTSIEDTDAWQTYGSDADDSLASRNQTPLQVAEVIGLGDSSFGGARVAKETATPKLGGFGVGVDGERGVVAHVEGMRSHATERAMNQERRTRSASGHTGVEEDDDLSHLTAITGLQRRRRSATEGWTGTKKLDVEPWGAHFWVIIDQPAGKSFFANPETGECAWAVPEGTIVLPPNEDGQWWELYDDDRKLAYYYQTRTRETRWEKPEGFVIPLSAIQESSLGRRFSRTEFGEESLAALAALPEEAVQRRVANGAAQPGQGSTSAGIASVPGGIPRRKRQPPPPTHSPQVDRRTPRVRASSHSDRRPPNAAMSARYGGVVHQSSGEEHSSGLSTIVSSTHLEGPSRTPPLRGSRLRSHAAADAAVLNALNTRRDKSMDLATLSSMEGPKPFRRERDPAKRGLVAALGGNKASNGATLAPSPSVEMARLSSGEHRVLPEALRTDILSFEGFARQKFTTHRTGLFGLRKVSVQRLARWQRSPIPAPLLPLEQPEDRRDAVRIFKVLLRIFGDRDAPVFWPKVPEVTPVGFHLDRPRLLSGTTTLPHGSTLVNDGPFSANARAVSPASSHVIDKCIGNGKSTPPPTPERRVKVEPWSPSLAGVASGDAAGPSILEEERWLLERAIVAGSAALRDEIYVQCMKQLTDNPGRDSVMRGWQFLGVLLVCFPPSQELHDQLRLFIDEVVRVTPHSSPLPGGNEYERKQDAEMLSVLSRHAANRLSVIMRRGPRSRAPCLAEIECATDAAFNPSVFYTLEASMTRQKEAYPDAPVPIIIMFLCDAMLAMDATRRAGIFRIAGDSELVTALRVRIEQGHYSVNGLLGDDDVDVLSSLFKLYLRELEEPIIPHILYKDCLKAASAGAARAIEQVLRLPPLNRRVVTYVVRFLQAFCAPDVVEQTHMSPHSIATIFAPNFLRCDLNLPLDETLNNSRLEARFVNHLLLRLPCGDALDPDSKFRSGATPLPGMGMKKHNASTPSRSSASPAPSMSLPPTPTTPSSAAERARRLTQLVAGTGTPSRFAKTHNPSGSETSSGGSSFNYHSTSSPTRRGVGEGGVASTPDRWKPSASSRLAA